MGDTQGVPPCSARLSGVVHFCSLIIHSYYIHAIFILHIYYISNRYTFIDFTAIVLLTYYISNRRILHSYYIHNTFLIDTYYVFNRCKMINYLLFYFAFQLIYLLFPLIILVPQLSSFWFLNRFLFLSPTL